MDTKLLPHVQPSFKYPLSHKTGGQRSEVTGQGGQPLPTHSLEVGDGGVCEEGEEEGIVGGALDSAGLGVDCVQQLQALGTRTYGETSLPGEILLCPSHLLT